MFNSLSRMPVIINATTKPKTRDRMKTYSMLAWPRENETNEKHLLKTIERFYASHALSRRVVHLRAHETLT